MPLLWYSPHNIYATWTVKGESPVRKLDKESVVPLYYQLKEILQTMVDDDDLAPGDSIPSERDICERFGISRMTASKAVSALVHEGILYRERGRGTFVASPKPTCTSSCLTGFSDNIRAAGLEAWTRILAFGEEEASRTIREALDLSPQEATVFNILRLRYVEGEPFSLENAWVPRCRFPGLSRDLLEGRSLYDLMRTDFSLKLSHARQTIEPVLCSDFEAGQLDLDPGTPVLLFRRVAYAEPQVAVEYSKCIYRGKRFKYEIAFGI